MLNRLACTESKSATVSQRREILVILVMLQCMLSHGSRLAGKENIAVWSLSFHVCLLQAILTVTTTKSVFPLPFWANAVLNFILLYRSTRPLPCICLSGIHSERKSLHSSQTLTFVVVVVVCLFVSFLCVFCFGSQTAISIQRENLHLCQDLCDFYIYFFQFQTGISI